VLGVEILPQEDKSEDSRLFDVRSGEVLRMISKSTRGDFYIGEPAWDDGNVRMFARQATKPGGGWTAGVDLIKMRGRTFDVEASIALFRSYLGFDRIIGDPSKNTFAVAYSTNRRVFYKTFSSALQETNFQVDHVLDTSAYGVLGRMITKEHEYVDPELGPIGCWNPHTGEKLWQVDDKGADRAVWLRNCALVGKQLRHPRTGKVIAEVPPNRVLVASSGITLWTLTVGANQRFEVWRLR
jgi:hypothetical protein